MVTQATSRCWRLLGLADEPAPASSPGCVGLALAVAVDVVIFLWLLRVVPSISHPLRRLLPGALFGAAGFEALKLLGGYYLSLISGSVTASAFGGAVGVCSCGSTWSPASRFFTAAWTATFRSGARRCRRPPPDAAPVPA